MRIVLFLTRGPYAPLLARAGEKSPECLICWTNAPRRLVKGCMVGVNLCFFSVFPTLLLITAGSAATGKHVPVQETGSPMRLTLQTFSFCCRWVWFISSRLYQSHPVSSSALPGVAVSCHVAIVAVCIIPDNEQRPQNLSQTQTTRSENIALPTITALSSLDHVYTSK